MIVVDASLAVKWMLIEADTGRALDLAARHRDEMFAPDLLSIEVVGAIVRRTNEGILSTNASGETLRLWFESWAGNAIRLIVTSADPLERAASLAMTLRHPLKDCIYLALAIELDCALATCDAKFAARARPLYPEVKLLADYA